MDVSLQERKLRIMRRLEFTLDSTYSLLRDINNRLEKIVESNDALEVMVDTYETWLKKNV